MKFLTFDQVFDSHFKIKVMPPGVFPICLYREAMHLQWFTPTRYVSGRGYAHINVLSVSVPQKKTTTK